MQTNSNAHSNTISTPSHAHQNGRNGLPQTESRHLTHSYSQPELFYEAFTLDRPHDGSGPQTPSSHPHINTDTNSSDFPTIVDSAAQNTSMSPVSPVPPVRYEFALEDCSGTTIISSPTMAQHAATHQRWIKERREEQQHEAEQAALALAAIQEEERQSAEAVAVDDDGDTQADATQDDTESSSLLSVSSIKRRGRSRAASSVNREEGGDEGEFEDEDELPELSPIELIALCLPAAAVMIGWAVGEALLLPYLLSLGVSPTVANFAFLVNPLFGLFLQPFFGRLSDHCTLSMGRRRPFLLLFCCGSITGLSIVVWSTELTKIFSGGQMGAGSILQIIFVFIGFAIMDLSHDLLLMPARALLNDRLPDEQTDNGNAYFASISSIGTCIGLALTIIPLEKYFPWSLLVEPVRATFTTAAIFILGCNLSTLYISRGLDKRKETRHYGYQADDQFLAQVINLFGAPFLFSFLFV